MESIGSRIQAIDAIYDVTVNLSGVAQALSAHSGREGDDMTAMLSFVVAAQLEQLRGTSAWLESQDAGESA